MYRQGPKQSRIDDTEYGSVDADTEGENDQGYDREPRISP
jgi:hypothetical protein